jgi:biopolymer transport protein ExbD
MKIVITIFLSFLLICCSNKKELDGYWYGEFKLGTERSPALLKFENGSFIDFFGLDNDTINYKRFGNIIYYENSFNEKQESKIKLSNNELTIFDSKSDSIIIVLKKSKNYNFVFDYLNDKNLKINLPSGKGLENKFSEFINLKWPIYVTHDENHLIANFLDTTVIVDVNFHKSFFHKKTSLNEIESFSNSNRISLIADKNLRISDIDLLMKQLKVMGFSRIDYYLKSGSYDKVNILTSSSRPLSKKEFNEFNTKENPIPPVPPPFIDYISIFKGDLMIVKIEGNILTVNDSIMVKDDFNEFIKSKILSGKELAILYYISENSTYENFIRFNEIVYNTYYDIRDDFLKNKVGLKFIENYDLMDKEIINVKKKYPLIFWQMDSLEYKKVKNTIQNQI